jgi:hypothetical protein
LATLADIAIDMTCSKVIVDMMSVAGESDGFNQPGVN